VSEPSCPRCGIVFAKARDRESRPAPRLPAPAETPGDRSPGGIGRLPLYEALAVAVAIGIGVAVLRHRSPAPPPAAGPVIAQSASPPRTATIDAPPAAPVPRVMPPLPPILLLRGAPAAGIDDADRPVFDELAGRVRAQTRIGPDDLQKGEYLLVRQPSDPARRSLLEALLLLASEQARGARRPTEAAAHARRAGEVQPGSPHASRALIAALFEAADWPGLEAAARDHLARDPRNAEALRALGFSLMRQDRGPEAREALKASLEARDDPSTRALFELVSKSLTDQQGMTEQRLSHFHVRYDGGQHEDVGREVLRALERHFATLSRTFDHQPAATIPVVLFGQQAYFDATGAPSWSGGQYDHFDGRITVPIGGLDSSLTPTLDGVLIHELAHAFVSDRSRGVAPREIQEGLAQYVEGQRAQDRLGSQGLQALAEGRVRGVTGFYVWSLAFVEQLMGERGQGGMNDALRIMGETGRADDAFSRVYGRSFAECVRAFNDRLRQQYAR